MTRWHKRHGAAASHASLAFIVLSAAILILNNTGTHISLRDSVVAIGAGVLLVWIATWVYFQLVSVMSRRGLAMERIAVFGGDETGINLAKQLIEYGGNEGRQFVGLFDNRRTRLDDVSEIGLSGDWNDVSRLAADQMIDHVIMTLPFEALERLDGFMEEMNHVAIKVTLIPAFGSLKGQQIELANLPASGWQLVAKTALDRIGGGLGLLAISPFLLAVAVAIRFDSRGPVFFYQERTGLNGKSFNIVKFRTMHGPGEDGHRMVQATSNDPRVTRIGDFLRRYSIDELPQLINVVTGDMSLVGPRPHAPGTRAAGQLFQDVYDGYAARARMKPGMTGWAQVNGYRGETDTVEKLTGRINLDLYYVDNWSLWFDIEILFRTIPAVLKAETKNN